MGYGVSLSVRAVSVRQSAVHDYEQVRGRRPRTGTVMPVGIPAGPSQRGQTKGHVNSLFGLIGGNTMASIDELRKAFTYDPDTGKFINHRTGREAASQKNRDGYAIMWALGTNRPAHRVAWAIFHGRWPEHEIDHINGVRDDNRIVNLRDVPRSFNQQNLRSSMPKRSRPAPLGVSWHRQAGRWRAMIWNGSKNIYLGLFDDANEAHQAYLEEKRRLHPGCTI